MTLNHYRIEITPEQARQSVASSSELNLLSGKSNAQKAIERMNAWAMDKHAMMFDCLGGLNAYKLKLIAEVITAKPLNIISNDDKLRRAADFLAHALQRLIKRVIEPTALQHPTNQIRLNSGAINRILFSHFARDNTSQIDSTAQIV